MNVRDEDGGCASEETLSKICQDAFASAEQALKLCEYVPKPSSSNVRKSDGGLCSVELQGLFIPAVNELRYAGKHLSDYIVSKSIDDLHKAYPHCIRAKHDAYDCLIQYYLSDFILFCKQYELIVIGDVVPEYRDYKQQVKEILGRNGRNAEAQGGYEEKKSDSDGNKGAVDELEKSADIREADCKTLKKICDTLDSYRDDLNAKLKKERSDRFYKLAGLIVSIVIAITAIIKLIV